VREWKVGNPGVEEESAIGSSSYGAWFLGSCCCFSPSFTIFSLLSMSSGVNVTSSLQLGLFSLEAPVGLVYCTFA
jgi:hypothetical protein